ncbi:MAG: hypothetical protein AAFR15_18445 [Cyanobacteria bacterium J06627_15]
MFQKVRQVSVGGAALRNLTKKEVQDLQAALTLFDEGYNAMVQHLRRLKATPAVYRIVNGTIKSYMGKPRSEVDLWDEDEMTIWAWSYFNIVENMEDLSDPAQVAYDSCRTAEQLYIELQYTDGTSDGFYVDF